MTLVQVKPLLLGHRAASMAHITTALLSRELPILLRALRSWAPLPPVGFTAPGGRARNYTRPRGDSPVLKHRGGGQTALNFQANNTRRTSFFVDLDAKMN